MVTDHPPVTTVSLLRCGCGQPTLRALRPVRGIGTKNCMLAGCECCGQRWLLRVRQGLSCVQLEAQPYGKAVDLTPAPQKPAAPEPVVQFNEIFQEGGRPDGVAWSV